VADLTESGVPHDTAVRDAISRLGDVDAIVDAVQATRANRSMSWRRIGRVPIAWIAVGAMSIVTFAAAELPQASGAKVPGPIHAPATHAPPARPEIRGQKSHTCRCSRVVARGHLRS
jgi:hypothetical protein